MLDLIAKYCKSYENTKSTYNEEKDNKVRDLIYCLKNKYRRIRDSQISWLIEASLNLMIERAIQSSLK